MASATYERILHDIGQLTDEERHRLRIELARTPDDSRPDAATILRTMTPLDPAVVDDMERRIEEGCERIDPNGW